MAKRIFDIILALVGLIIFMPCITIISLAIYLEDGRPVLFLQDRVGREGKIFKIIKFRSMKKTNAPYLDVDLLQNDPRVTRVGRFLRATAMDELPQLANILAGQMSFVGPKPLLYSVDDDEKLCYKHLDQVPGYDIRIKALPGLTGIAQIYAPKDASRREKFRFDKIYVNNQSLLLDIKLILISILVTIKAGWESKRKNNVKQD